MQVITYIAGLLSTRINGRVLVVAPKTLLGTWKSELDKWAPSLPKYVYDPDVAMSHRKRNLSLVIEKGGKCVHCYYTYALITTRTDLI